MSAAIRLIIVSLSVLLPFVLSGAPCVVDTLNNYESLGATGCDMGSLTYKNFSFSTVSSSGGAIPITSSAISVTPTVGPGLFQMGFNSAGFSVTGLESITYLLAFTIDPPPPVLPDMRLDMFAFSPVFPGLAQITLDMCVNNTYTGPVCNLPGSPDQLVVSHNGIVFNSTDSTTFPLTYIVDLRATIQLSANGASSQFDGFDVITHPTPEPASWMLLAPVALLLRRRYGLKF